MPALMIISKLGRDREVTAAAVHGRICGYVWLHTTVCGPLSAFPPPKPVLVLFLVNVSNDIYMTIRGATERKEEGWSSQVQCEGLLPVVVADRLFGRARDWQG